MHVIQMGLPLFLSVGDAMQERAFKSVSEHKELQFPFDKGKITNRHFTSRQLICLHDFFSDFHDSFFPLYTLGSLTV